MRIPKVFILYRNGNDDDKDRAKEIKKLFFTASQMVNKQVDVEITHNLREFTDLNIKKDEMPIVVVNNNVVFTKHVPPVEFVKQCIASPQEQQNYF